MNDTISTNQRPSATGSFFRGLLSGAGSGLLMASLVALVAPFVIPGALAAGLGTAILSSFLNTAPLMMIVTGLFSGIISAKRSFDDNKQAPIVAPIPIGTAAGPVIVPTVSHNLTATPDTPEQAPTKNWVAETGRSGDSQSRVQQILDNGAISDKARASAILAAREAASTQDNQRLM